ncbi:DUF4144 family protein [Oceanisphaera sp.]|uniref:DUF4144 family protein n=1 Tax=Oceanisphaera sp. TaxID=1929979 RepID=UPI003A91F2E4
MIHWPVIIEFAQGHDYAWAAGPEEVAEHRLEAGDRLLDSQGQAHILSHESGAGLYWQQDEGLVSVPELNIKLQGHAASLGVCCTSKLVVRTPADAIALVAWLEQQ